MEKSTIAPHISFISGFFDIHQKELPLPTLYSALAIDKILVQVSEYLTVGVYGICHGSESPEHLIAKRNNWFLAFSGKIYNLPELRARAAKHDSRFPVLKEAEILLILYLYDKEWLLNNLNAKFCAVITDLHTLILLRDKVGEEQIYYGMSGSSIAFSSEIKIVSSLLGNPELRFSESFKLFETPVGENTMHQGIFKLEAGTEVKIDLRTKRITKNKYWNIQSLHANKRTEREYVEELSNLLTDAIRVRIPQDKQTSAYLSGGQDSSFVCGTLARLNSKPAFVYTTAWNSLDSVYNEEPWAAIMAQSINVKHIVLQPGPDDFSKHFPITLWILDEVKANAAHFIEYWIAKEAYHRGDASLFSGYGSDEILGGEIRYLVMYLDRDRKKTFPLFNSHPLLKNYKPLMLKLAELPSDTHEAKKYYHLIKRGDASLSSETYYQELIKHSFDQFPTLIDKMGYTDILISAPPLLDSSRLNKYWGVDKISPFLDYRVVEYAFSLPENLKIEGYTTKKILRLASSGLVPDVITNRPDKVGFAFPHNDRRYARFLLELADALKKRLGNTMSVRTDKTRGRYDRTILMLASQEILHRFYTDRDFSLIKHT